MLSQPELGSAHASLRKLLEGYEKFLSNTDAPEEDLISRFMDRAQRMEYLASAYRFGDLVFEVYGQKLLRRRLLRLFTASLVV